MPTSVGPNTKGEENLVFGYDLSDNYNSYIGEPATNSQAYSHSAMTQAGFDAWGCYDGNNSSPAYHSWGNAQSKTLVSITGPNGKYVNAMLYHNFTGGFHGPTNWSGVAASLLTNGSKITVQGWVKAADAASVGKTVTPYLYYSKVGGGSYSTGTGYTLTANWQLVSHSYTVPEGSTGTGTMYFFTSGGTDIKMYLTNTAIVGGKLHAVQWLPGGTTRSATQGLLDLTGNSTIDLSNVSFDSNAQMTFDGTSDYATIPHNTVMRDTETLAIETVFQVYSQFGYYGGIIGKGTSDTDEEYFLGIQPSGNRIYFDVGIGSGPYVNAVQTINSNQYYHVVAMHQRIGSTSVCSIYVNGEFASNTTSGATNSVNTNTTDITVGARWSNGSSSFNGAIPLLKMYNRILSAEEIKSNFNAIKGRFGI